MGGNAFLDTYGKLPEIERHVYEELIKQLSDSGLTHRVIHGFVNNATHGDLDIVILDYEIDKFERVLQDLDWKVEATKHTDVLRHYVVNTTVNGTPIKFQLDVGLVKKEEELNPYMWYYTHGLNLFLSPILKQLQDVEWRPDGLYYGGGKVVNPNFMEDIARICDVIIDVDNEPYALTKFDFYQWLLQSYHANSFKSKFFDPNNYGIEKYTKAMQFPVFADFIEYIKHIEFDPVNDQIRYV
nr:MAG TPA: Lincosamide resistance protein [Caudoviricetes sp.]